MIETIFRSSVLKQDFTSEEDALAAEKEYEDKHEAEVKARQERAEDAKKVKEAFENAYTLRNEFVKKYGSYHSTYTSINDGDSLFKFIFG